MDTALFQQDLPIQLGDPSNQIFTASTIQTIMCLAVRAYRRWRPLLRPFGMGVIYSVATAGQNVVQTMGGPFSVGQSVVITDQGNSLRIWR